MTEPLNNQQLSEKVIEIQAQLFAIQAELKLIRTIFAKTEILGNEDYIKALNDTVNLILNETEKENPMGKLVKQYLPKA